MKNKYIDFVANDLKWILSTIVVSLTLGGCDPQYKVFIKNNTNDTVYFAVGKKKNPPLSDPNFKKIVTTITEKKYDDICLKEMGYTLYPNQLLLLHKGNLAIEPSPYRSIDYLKIHTKARCINIMTFDELKKNIKKSGFDYIIEVY